jgi:Cu(I)/Ag(I) efflux system protein CusF
LRIAAGEQNQVLIRGSRLLCPSRRTKMLRFVFTAFLATALSVTAAIAQTRPEVAGEVKQVDQSAGEITLQHDRIPNLDMDGMTMAFKASDPAMLKNLKAGDKVKFQADMVHGDLIVTSIEKAE